MTNDNRDEGRANPGDRGQDQTPAPRADGREPTDVGPLDPSAMTRAPVTPGAKDSDAKVSDAKDSEEGDPGVEELLQELRAIVSRIDPMPPEIVAAAKAGFIWHTIDAELAQLTSDSVLDADRMAAVRGVATPELLTFESAGLTVEVETAAGPDGVRLLGQLVPAQAGSVEVRHGGGTVTVDADDMGRFTAAGLRAGPVSLSCRTAAGGLHVATDWFLAR